MSSYRAKRLTENHDSRSRRMPESYWEKRRWREYQSAKGEGGVVVSWKQVEKDDWSAYTHT